MSQVRAQISHEELDEIAVLDVPTLDVRHANGTPSFAVNKPGYNPKKMHDIDGDPPGLGLLRDDKTSDG